MSLRRLTVNTLSNRKAANRDIVRNLLTLQRLTVPSGPSGITFFPLTYLVVAGGGGSAIDSDTFYSGGAGAGGVLQGIVTIPIGITLSLSVGGGGSVNSTGSNSFIRSSDGNSSMNVESAGGGRGGCYHRYQGFFSPEPGGSGGGDSGGDGTGTRAGATGIPGQGGNGGSASLTPGGFRPSGGGGGGGGNGGNGTGPGTGAGGAAYTSTITGTSVSYAGGGAGVSGSTSAPGGAPAGSGTINTGGGAGGGSQGTTGGSGLVIVRMSNTIAALATTTGSQTKRSAADGNTAFVFTGAGSITF